MTFAQNVPLFPVSFPSHFFPSTLVFPVTSWSESQKTFLLFLQFLVFWHAYSCFSLFCFIPHSCFAFWSLYEICLFAVRFVLFMGHSVMMPALICLSFPLFSLSYKHEDVFFFLAVLFSQIFVRAICARSICGRSFALAVFCAKMKRSLLSAVCCFRSESFSSGSLPHAASLTAWVKQTDPPRIANVLQGNQLNYSHCGSEDIHWHQTPQGYAVFSPKASSCLLKMAHRCVTN